MRPVDRAAGRQAARVGDDDERGQVVGLAAQAIGQPGAERREAVQAKAGVLLKRRRRVVRRLGDHRVDDGQFVGHLGEVREQVGDPQPALAAPAKRPVALPQQADLAEEDVGPFAAIAAIGRAAGRAPACSRTNRPGSAPRTGRCGWHAGLGTWCGDVAGFARRGVELLSRCERPGGAQAPPRPWPPSARNRGDHDSLKPRVANLVHLVRPGESLRIPRHAPSIDIQELVAIENRPAKDRQSVALDDAAARARDLRAGCGRP